MYTIEPLYGASGSGSETFAINAVTDVAGLSDLPNYGGEVGTIWSAAVPVVSLPDGSESILYAINAAGNAVGVRGWNNSDTQIAILVQGGVVSDIDSEVGAGSIATGINDGGLICGWGWGDVNSFLYNSVTHAAPVLIAPLAAGSRSVATAVNTAGDVVGTSDDHGFYYSQGTLTDLGPAAFVEHINDAGQVCGSVGKTWPQAFSPGIWDVSQSPPVFREIPVPPVFLGGHADGINSKGEVVGTCWTPQSYDTSQSVAYLYSGGVSTDLNSLIPPGSGWHLTDASAINDNGQITGYGLYNGASASFLLTPTSVSLYGNGFSLAELVALLILGGVTVDGEGTVILPGGGPIPVGPWGPFWQRLPVAKRDLLIGLALEELATHITDASSRERIRRTALEAVRGRVESLIDAVQSEKTGAMPAQVTGKRHLGKSQMRLRRHGKQAS